MKGIREINKGDAIGLEFTEQKFLSGDLSLDREGFKFSKQVGGNKISLTYDATSVVADCSQANVFKLILTGNVAEIDAINIRDGATYIFIIEQDGTGNHTLGFATKFFFEGGTAPTITVGAEHRDVISAVCDGTSLLCSVVQDILITI